MAVTPLIKKISNPNGTFIAFQSAVNDSNLIGSQQGYRFSFSKYALIKIPEIKAAETLPEGSEIVVSDKNYVNLDGIGEKYNTSEEAGGLNLSKDFAESFQNYCLNLEALILTSVDKTASLNANVSEEIFWKWLKETGAIRFEQGEVGENGFVRKNLDSARFIEPRSGEYSRVVRYINDISAVNVTMDGSVYTEVYIYTPTDHGQSPVVLFSSGDNKFYSSKTGKAYSSLSEYIYGRDYNSEHPDNLSVSAIFDYDMDGASTVTCYIKDVDAEEWTEGNWFDEYKGNTSTGYYYVDSIGSTKDMDIKKVSGATGTGRSVAFRRSTLDGIKIDWNVSKTYSLNALGIRDEEMSDFTLNEFNTVGDGECREFDYNAALLYYDLTNVVTGETKSYLYGIYFLNKVSVDGTGDIAYIPSVTKYRSNSLSTIEGNAIGYKINLRTDTSFDNLTNISTSTASNNFSMDLFHESLSAMKTFSDTLNGKITYISNLYEELEQLKRLFIDDQNKDEILLRISNLEEEFHNFSESSVDVSFLSNVEDYINDLYRKYSNIMSNKTPIRVEYDYNKYKINSMVEHNQQYTLQPDSYKRNIFDEGANVLKLNEYTNYYKHYIDADENPENAIIELIDDYDIIIDDSENEWHSGQTLRLVFSSEIVMENNVQIRVKTDYRNVYGDGSLNCIIAVIEPNMIEGPGHIFDIICIDPNNMIFELDQIK